MNLTQSRLKELMEQYIADNEAYGDESESQLINEIFTGFKPVLLESKGEEVSVTLLQEHSNSLGGVPKDIFDDFILYAFADEDNKLV